MPVTKSGPYNSGDASGGDGSASSQQDTPIEIRGAIAAVQIKYNDSPPAGTTDVTIKTTGSDAPSTTILTVSNTALDAKYYPRETVHTNTASAVSDVYTAPWVSDKITVSIAQANSGDSVDVWLTVVT